MIISESQIQNSLVTNSSESFRIEQMTEYSFLIMREILE